MKNNQPHPIYQLKSQWQQDSHSVWIATSLCLMRNIAKFKFPAKLDKSRQHQVISLLNDGLKNCSEIKDLQLFRSEELTPIEKEYLLEHFLVSDGFYQAHGGEGFAIDNSSSFLAVMNIANHLQLQINDSTQEIEKTWTKLLKIEECVGKTVDYAYNSRFGFLTNDSSTSGTGLTITLFLHIPAIIHAGELSELIDKEKEEEIDITGLQGSSNEMIGDILIAKNRCTLGLSEEYLITSLRMWATKAVIAEMNLRKKIKSTNDYEALKNKVTRALGLLTHSYQLETIEALNAVSLVKLGIELGWIKQLSDLNFNEVFFNCRRAHLMHLLDSKVSVPELPRKRAEYLHSICKQLALEI